MRTNFTTTCGLIIALAATDLSQAQSCGQWLSAGGVAGTSWQYDNADGRVDALTVWDPDDSGPRSPMLLAFGVFSEAGDVESRGAVGWDGERWWSLSELGIDIWGSTSIISHQNKLYAVRQSSVVRWSGSRWETIATFFGGDGAASPPLVLASDGDRVYAGGSFQRVNDTSAAGVAAWDGGTWQPIGPGVPWTVRAITSDAGAVYVGGDDGVGPRAAAFSRATWAAAPLAFAEASGSVGSLVVFNGHVWSGGALVGASPNRASVAVWDGQSWQPTGLLGTTRGLHTTGNRLFAFGVFPSTLRHVPQPAIVELAGQSWQRLGDGLPNADVRTVASFNGALIAGGRFDQAGGIGVSNLAKFANGSWAPVGNGIGYAVTALADWNGQPVAGGSGRVSQWTGTNWTALGDSIGYRIDHLIEFQGELIAAGSIAFRDSDGRLGRDLLRYSGGWRTMPADPPLEGVVSALCKHQGNLVVFLGNSAMTWDGNSWDTRMGTLTGPTSQRRVVQATEFQEDLIAVGSFVSAGGVPALGVARWDGQEWHAMDIGLPTGATPAGVAVWRGNLVATASRRLWRWDGARWQVQGAPPANAFASPGKLTVSRDELYAVRIGTGTVLRHDGAGWRDVGTDWSTAAFATAAAAGGELWVGFSSGHNYADGVLLGYVSRWIDRADPPRTSRVSPAQVSVREGTRTALRVRATGTGPYSIRWFRDGEVVTTGTSTPLGLSVSVDSMFLSLQVTGTTPAAAGTYTAEVSNACGSTMSDSITLNVRCAADFNGDGRVSIEDLVSFFALWFAHDDRAEEDGRYPVTVDDLLLFLARYLAGCP